MSARAWPWNLKRGPAAGIPDLGEAIEARRAEDLHLARRAAGAERARRAAVLGRRLSAGQQAALGLTLHGEGEIWAHFARGTRYYNLSPAGHEGWHLAWDRTGRAAATGHAPCPGRTHCPDRGLWPCILRALGDHEDRDRDKLAGGGDGGAAGADPER